MYIIFFKGGTKKKKKNFPSTGGQDVTKSLLLLLLLMMTIFHLPLLYHGKENGRVRLQPVGPCLLPVGPNMAVSFGDFSVKIACVCASHIK